MTELLTKDAFGGSLDELKVRKVEREEKGENPLGLLRRAFSSRNRKKSKNKKSVQPTTTGQYLAVPHTHHRPTCRIHQPLRAVRSNPSPGSLSPNG